MRKSRFFLRGAYPLRRSKDFCRGVELGRVKVVSAGLDPELQVEAIHSYGMALHRVYVVRDEWDRLGSPVTSTGSQGQTVAHPLLAALESAERHLDAADAALTRQRAVRPGQHLRQPARRALGA
jgi:hypothetical protein